MSGSLHPAATHRRRHRQEKRNKLRAKLAAAPAGERAAIEAKLQRTYLLFPRYEAVQVATTRRWFLRREGPGDAGSTTQWRYKSLKVDELLNVRRYPKMTFASCQAGDRSDCLAIRSDDVHGHVRIRASPALSRARPCASTFSSVVISGRSLSNVSWMSARHVARRPIRSAARESPAAESRTHSIGPRADGESRRRGGTQDREAGEG